MHECDGGCAASIGCGSGCESGRFCASADGMASGGTGTGTGFKPWRTNDESSESESPSLSQHIFIKEMYAAVEGANWAASVCAARGIYLVVDNSAVAGAVKRGYSSNLLGSQILGTLRRSVEVVMVPSKSNVADSHSRNVPIESLRERLTHQAVLNDLNGLRCAEVTRHPNVGRGRSGIRHPEGFDDDLEIDEVPVECMVTKIN